MASPNPIDHNLNKLYSTLPEYASTQVLFFLANCFLEDCFKNANNFTITIIYFPLKESVALHLRMYTFLIKKTHAIKLRL